MKRLQTRVITATAGLLMAAASSIAIASPASAGVWNCQTGYASYGAYAYCASGDSAYFKVNVLCQNIFTLGSRNVSGPARRVGGQIQSVVSGCAWNERYYGNPWANSA